ncbi:thermonuclease family protein [Patescibacteria group bacterium]|nr:thermonuclease family protein [Patescibacteria group bacterium]
MKYRAPVLLLLLGIFLIFSGLLNKEASNNRISDKSTSSLNKPKISTASGSIEYKESSLAKEEVLVTRILDGDTIETSKGERIRYLGINAPETGQPFSSDATLANKTLVLGKKVSLELDVQTKDGYGRTLSYAFAGNTFVNLEIVRKGLAVSETLQPNVKYQDEILKAQKDARNNCLGIWKNLCSSKDDVSSSCVKILSIKADASGNDNQNKNGEWVEIGNTCSYSVSMSGWLLKDSSASNNYQFHEFTMSAGGKVNLYSGCGKDSAEKLYWQCPEKKYAVWNNSGDHAFLYNDKGEMVSDYEY